MDVPSRRELEPPLDECIPTWFLMASSAEDALQAKSEDERSLSDLAREGMTPADLAVMRADYGYLQSVNIDGFARALLDRNRELALP